MTNTTVGINQSMIQYARPNTTVGVNQTMYRSHLMTDIADLFARDPEHLTTANIDHIIAKYREARAQFQLGLKQAGSAKTLKSPKLTNLDDLDLDL